MNGLLQVGKTTLVAHFLGKTKKGYYFISGDAVAAINRVWLGQQLISKKQKTAKSLWARDKRLTRRICAFVYVGILSG
jgi:TolB-like protein